MASAAVIKKESAVKANFYVDGFNLYHGLMEHSETRDCRWLNLRSLAESLLMEGHQLQHVYFFTSLPVWNQKKRERHSTYIAALQSVGVKIVPGRFAPTHRMCRATCKLPYNAYAEKETDVNIATQMLSDAIGYEDEECHWAYLITGDADQVATINAIHQLSDTKVYVICPPRRDSGELRDVADDKLAGTLNARRFRAHLFPDVFETKNRVFRKPRHWVDQDTGKIPYDNQADQPEHAE